MRRNLAAAVLAVIVSTVLPSAPAQAASNVGVVGFQGKAVLPKFPCPLPPNGTGPCNGAMTAAWHGHATGDVYGGTYDVVWTTRTTDGLTASFTYWEHQCVEPSTMLGGANGSGSGYAGPGNVFGAWQSGTGLPQAITEVRAAFDFDWTRVATGALITFRSIGLYLNISGLGWVRVSSSAIPGAAIFVPLTISEIHQPTCSQPVAISGQFAGEVTLTS